MTSNLDQLLLYLQKAFLADQIDSSTLSTQDLQRCIQRELAPHLIGSGLSSSERKILYQEVFDILRGYGPIQTLMNDPQVTEIMVNHHETIFYEVRGKIHVSDLKFTSEEQLLNLIQQIFGARNRQLSRQYPMAEVRLPDGSRAHAVIRPVSPEGPLLTIRKFTGIRPDIEALIDSKFLTKDQLKYLKFGVAERQAIFIAGGTGTGKTTLLNALSSFIPSTERVITIEDACELQLQGLPNLVRMEAQRSGPDGRGEVTISELIRAALRMRPDRIIVGEVRGAEAVDLMQAMNTGHPGTLCTGHGNSPAGMLRRLAQLIYSHANLPYETVIESLAEGFQWLVHLERNPAGHRYVKELVRCHGMKSGRPQLEQVA